ncbi:hypothetical protein [Streptomyces sp. NRRL S-1022]|uniref:hypothetical protein n=1 Tax=Streptomyces sp. NRRL S-1022 TaxID=1463880 RepID=UPI0004BF3358|nr:hypothetical protein [Streptomyces sp. NRRL S-1022]
MTAEWYVLIEEDTRTTERPDGVELRLHRWMLVGTYRIGQDEADAVAAAEDAALNYMPGVLARHARPGDEPARHAFLAQDGAWVVLLRQRHRECHIRVTTARLMHSQEDKEAPPKSLKEKFRNTLEGPPPSLKPWTPPKQRGQS